LHPSDFRVRTLDGVADDWPIDYATLEPFFAENDRMMGISGLAGDPAYPPERGRRCRRCRWAAGEAMARGFNAAGLALVAVRQRDRHAGLRRRARLHQPGPLHGRLRPGRQEQHRHHLLAEARRAGVELRTRLPGARDPRRRRHGHRRDLLRRRRRASTSSAPRW
jgi:choline dehydrogenase-like flavoprotein